MELLGRRWDRWDLIVAAAAVTLILVSDAPWYAFHVEGTSGTTWNAWRHWQWSKAVALGTLAAAVFLGYRGRPESRGAAWLAVVMLLGGLGLTGWQWHQARDVEVKIIRIVSHGQRSDETDKEYRRRQQEQFAVAQANAPRLPTRSVPRQGLYVGAGSLIVMLVAITRGLMRSRPTPG